MADKRKAPAASEGAHRRKRPAPTIDLTATEITAPAPGETAQQASTEPNAPAGNAPDEAMTAATSETSTPPAEEPPTAQAETASHGEAAPPYGKGIAASALAGGFAGGFIAAAALGVLWYGGALTREPAQRQDSSAQIAAVQKQIQELQNRPAPPAAAIDTKAIDALNARVAKMENTLANLPKGDGELAQRVEAAEKAMKSLGLALTALNKRSDEIAASADDARRQAAAADKAVTDLRGSAQSVEKSASAAIAPAALEALQQRVATLEQAVKTARDEIAKTKEIEKAARLAMIATALRNAVASGNSFTAELAQAKALGAADKMLAPLTPFAASGVPSAQSLALALRELLPDMASRVAAQPAGGGFLEKLQANASRLVRITPVDTPKGNDSAAILARIDIAAARADIAAALREFAKLPEAARALAQSWIDKAKTREAALTAATEFAASSARTMSER